MGPLKWVMEAPLPVKLVASLKIRRARPSLSHGSMVCTQITLSASLFVFKLIS
jgi:hypothetical protein